MFRYALCASAALLSLAHAQEERPLTREQLSFAAGYKAQFTCSATFNAGKMPEQIAAHELTNIYPDFGPAMAATPAAVIDHDDYSVSVTYADDYPPRIAVWRPSLGCASLPPGSTDTQIVATRPGAMDMMSSATGPVDLPWPDGDVMPRRGTITVAPMDALAMEFTKAFDGEYGGVTSAVLVVHDGQIVGEQYLDGFTPYTSQRTWSVAKSIGATVIGAAVHRGIIDPAAPSGIPQWSAGDDPRATITLENLLHMGSGLNSDPAGNRTDEIYFGGGLVTDHATSNLLEAVPGERWRYANNDTMLSLLALRASIGNDAAYLDFPFSAVLEPIGMRNTYLETDWQGNFILSSQVWTTARDLARLGILYLNDGVWDRVRILPEGWTDYVTAPAPAQPSNAHQRPNRGYGAQFWLYQGYPGVPEGTYAALGNRGQFVIIVPERNVVIVRRGYDYSGERFNGPAFTAAVLAAIR